MPGQLGDGLTRAARQHGPRCASWRGGARASEAAVRAARLGSAADGRAARGGRWARARVAVHQAARRALARGRRRKQLLASFPSAQRVVDILRGVQRVGEPPSTAMDSLVLCEVRGRAAAAGGAVGDHRVDGAHLGWQSPCRPSLCFSARKLTAGWSSSEAVRPLSRGAGAPSRTRPSVLSGATSPGQVSRRQVTVRQVSLGSRSPICASGRRENRRNLGAVKAL